MFIDVVIHESVVTDVVIATLSKLETAGIAPQLQNYRNICAWQPADNLLEEPVSFEQILAFDVARSNVQLLEDRPSVTAERAMLVVPNGVGAQARFPPNVGRFSLSIAANVASSAALYWAGTRPTAPEVVRRTVTMAVEAAFATSAAGNSLNLRLSPVAGFGLPDALGANRLAGLLGLLQGIPIPIPLAGLERTLGGVQFVGVSLRTIPASHVVVLRLLYVPIARWTPRPADSQELAATLAAEYDAFNRVPGNTFAAQLRNDENTGERIAIMVNEPSLKAVMLSFMQTALSGPQSNASLETSRVALAFAPLPPQSGIALSSDFDVRIHGACRSQIRDAVPAGPAGGGRVGVPLSDVVVSLGAAISMNVRNQLFELRVKVSPRIHGGWLALCASNQISELGHIARPLGDFALLFLIALFPLYIWLTGYVASIIQSIPYNPQDLANRSNNTFIFDAATGELVSRQPVLDFSLGAPSVLLRAVPPNAPAGATAQPVGNLAVLGLTSVSERNGVVRFGLSLRPDVVAGSLTVTPRVPIGGQPPAPGRLADWVWTYRTCEPTFNPALPEQEEHPAVLALSLQIWNERNPQDPFFANALEPMDICSIGLTGAVTLVGGFDLNPIKFEWQNPNSRDATRAPPRRLSAAGNSDRLNLIVYIPFRAFLDQWELSRLPHNPITGADTRAALRFLARPGFLVIPTSAGRRWIELPSLNGFTPSGGDAVVRARQIACGSGRREVNWDDSFAGRDARARLPGPDPFVLLNRLLNDSVRAQLPRLNLPNRNAGGLYSVEQRSVNAVLGRRAPNNAALAGLGPSNLNNIPAPMAAPIGLARLPRRP